MQARRISRSGEITTILTILVLATIAFGAIIGANSSVRENLTRFLPRADVQACPFSARAEVREGTVTGPMISQAAVGGWTITNNHSRILPMDTHADGAWTLWKEEPLQFKGSGGDYDPNEHAWVVLSGQNLFSDYTIKQVFCSSAGTHNACPQNLVAQNDQIAVGGPGHTITDFVINCNTDITYGWVVERKQVQNPTPTATITQTPTGGPTQGPTITTAPTATIAPTGTTATPTPLACTLTSLSCEPKNVSATVSDTTRMAIRWDYPTSCPGFQSGTDEFIINVRDGSNAIVCGKTITAQSTNTTTSCQLGVDTQRVTRALSSWVADRYRLEVITKKALSDSCTGIPGIGYLTYTAPTVAATGGPLPTGNAACPANAISGRTVYQNSPAVSQQVAYVDNISYPTQSISSLQPTFEYNFNNIETRIYTFISSVFRYYKNAGGEGWYEYKQFTNKPIAVAACQLIDTLAYTANTQCDDINCPKAVTLRDEVYRDFGLCSATQQSINTCGVYFLDGTPGNGSTSGCLISFSDKISALHESVHHFQVKQNGLTPDQQVAFVKKVANLFKNSPEIPSSYIERMSGFFPQGCRNFKSMPEDYPTACAQNADWKEIHAYIGESLANPDPNSSGKFMLARTKEYYQGFYCDASKLPSVISQSTLSSDSLKTVESPARAIPDMLELKTYYQTNYQPDASKAIFSGSVQSILADTSPRTKAEGKAILDIRASGKVIETIVTDESGNFVKAIPVSKQGENISVSVKNKYGVPLGTIDSELFPELYYVYDFTYSLSNQAKNVVSKKYYYPILVDKSKDSYDIQNQVVQRFDFQNLTAGLQLYTGRLTQSQQTIAGNKKIFFTSQLDGPIFLEASLKTKDKRKTYDGLIRSDCNNDAGVNGIDYATVIREYSTPDFIPCDPDKNGRIDARDTSLIIANLGKKAE